jgi:hypothetical protein
VVGLVSQQKEVADGSGSRRGFPKQVALAKKKELPAEQGRLGPETEVDGLAAVKTIISTKEISPFVKALIETLPSKLTNAEAHVWDAHFQDLQRERETLELSLAQSEEVEPGSVLITIPEYHKRGLPLLLQFADRLATEIGGSRGKQITRESEMEVRKENRDFGIKEQQILIEYDGSVFRVVHGSGFAKKINGALSISTITTMGSMRPQDVVGSRYAYLKPFFPAKNSKRSKWVYSTRPLSRPKNCS